MKDALRNTLLSVDFRLLAWPLPAPWPSGSPRPSSGGTSLSRRFLPWAAASSRCQCGTGMSLDKCSLGRVWEDSLDSAQLCCPRCELIRFRKVVAEPFTIQTIKVPNHNRVPTLAPLANQIDMLGHPGARPRVGTRAFTPRTVARLACPLGNAKDALDTIA